ncbi:uncharacterized protein Z520_04981 [Fonsecaea multimorphosa CBS 102226]|uniref:Transcription factor domain-containing protein n=1 Tax=Fonsecaea multimorphosa CBS 102226 TaxID=1442371 RepID=A0A0D2HC28_9EURO|nr:uncharacterized protein Z520_04981 [Fonsecaea multimorphosa CBS 102226]KIX99405.1 hypothetical protein Z520_04981 [Fonsecaea multimorphosa CBS 102226]OAL25733.1 hypothetical protein AYO22_04722 [Fonsecaea multimorphosa]
MAYSGDLLWVNHDAKNRKAEPNRHKVFSHIQSGYHKWRRVEAARSMRKSVVIPRLQSAAIRRRRDAKDTQKKDGEVEFDVHRDEQDDDNQRTRVKPEEALEQPIQSIVAFRGNSDPFNSTPVPITSRINEIMTFERRCVFPVIQGPEPHLQAQAKGNILPSWSSFASDSLCDNMTALAFLSTPLTLMAQSSPDSSILKLSLVHRYRSLQALQAYIREHGQPPLHILMHNLVAEIWAHNCDDALAHLRMAKIIMESQMRENPAGIVPYKWISVFQMDIHRAALSLTRTLLPMDGWGTAPFEVPLPIMDVYLDACLKGALRALFIELQQLDALYDFFINDPSARPTVWNFMRMRTLVLIGRAINHAVDGRDVSASLALAYVLKLVSALENIPVGATSIYNAGPKMLGRVRSCLDAESLSPRLRLWILYVGALSGDEWFTQRFDEQTVLMAVHTWEACKNILSRFYLPKDEPQVHFHAIFDARLSNRILELTTAFQDVKLHAG